MSNLYILTPSEQQAFDYPPSMPVEIQTVCFAINNLLEKEINALRSPINKIGFLLQYAYFRACKRFFIVNRFTQEHINTPLNYLALLLMRLTCLLIRKKCPSNIKKRF